MAAMEMQKADLMMKSKALETATDGTLDTQEKLDAALIAFIAAATAVDTAMYQAQADSEVIPVLIPSECTRNSSRQANPHSSLGNNNHLRLSKFELVKGGLENRDDADHAPADSIITKRCRRIPVFLFPPISLALPAPVQTVFESKNPDVSEDTPGV